VPSGERRFTRGVEAITDARHYVDALIAPADEDLRDVVLLLVTELARNAVGHGQTDFVVRVSDAAASLRVEVADFGGGEPQVRAASPDQLAGRGLHLVDALSSSWGIERAPSTTTVWFDLHRGTHP